jgi:mannonate dehydratase
MNRRNLLKMATAGSVAPFLTPRHLAAQEKAQRATRAMPSPKIKDVQVITCQPAGVRLIVVKVLTDQDGLYGYGCGTFTQRADLVVPAVEKYRSLFSSASLRIALTICGRRCTTARTGGMGRC